MLTRILAAKQARDDAALNAALVALGDRLRSSFERKLAASAAEMQTSGYLKTIEEVEDALNDALFRIYSKIETYRGTTDAEAFVWTKTIVSRIVADKRRKFLRRRAIWNEFLRSIPNRLRKFLETTERDD